MKEKITAYLRAHRFLSVVIAIVVLGGGYFAFKKITTPPDVIKYVVATVQKGTVVASISGSGQVSAANQIDLKPKASGQLLYLGVTEGQHVVAGQLIATLDSRDAYKTVRDAQVNLQSAQLSLQKLQKPTDNLSLVQAQNNLAQAQDSKQKATDDLTKAYDDAFTTASNVYLDLPTVMSGIQDLLYGSNGALGGSTQSNMDFYANAISIYDMRGTSYRNDADARYQTSRVEYTQTLNTYKATSRSADHTAIEGLLNSTYAATKDIAETVKSVTNLIGLYQDTFTNHSIKYATIADTQITALNGYTTKLNSALANLLSAKNALQNDRTAIVNADRTITESTASMEKLQAGTDPLDISSAQLSLKQRQNALYDAYNTLADYSVRAPFEGTIAKIVAKKFDTIGSGTAVATLITKQKIAELSLNEVDAAKIKTGDKATLTFDAIDGLSISGEVAEVDSIGTVTQGVVTYAVKIGFDTQDDRVKTGMSVSAAIVIDVHTDVLTIPGGAVKNQDGQSYVEVFSPPISATGGNAGTASATPPIQQSVEVGIASDTMTEIISGLKEGDQVVTRIITSSSAKTTTTQAPSLFGSAGGNRGGGAGGGAVRIPRN